MTRSKWIRAGMVGAGCAAVGAVAGIAGGAAAPSSSSSTQPSGRQMPMQGWRGAQFRRGDGLRRGPFRELGGGPPVHAQLVVPKRSGSGFETVTQDAGKVKSVSGDQLAITEGTDTQTYKDVTLTIPSNATVYRNGSKASLGDLKAGDHVRVAQSPEGTFVMARDASHQAQWDGPHPGMAGPGGPGGPPPYGQ